MSYIAQAGPDTCIKPIIHQAISWLQACNASGLCDQLRGIAANFEAIHKHLEVYLERKRQAFARLYFISPLDLLDIMGQTCTPALVQPHLKKCFEGAPLQYFLLHI